MTKFARRGLSQAIDREPGSQGLRTCVVCPSATKTEFEVGIGRTAYLFSKEGGNLELPGFMIYTERQKGCRNYREIELTTKPDFFLTSSNSNQL